MDRVTKVSRPRNPNGAESSSEISAPHCATDTCASESEPDSWREGTVGMTPRAPANTSIAKAIVAGIAPPPFEPLPAASDCSSLRVALHLPFILSGITVATGLAMTTAGGMGLHHADTTPSPVFFYEGLFIGGAAIMVVGLISGMMTTPSQLYSQPEPGSAV